MWLCHIQLLLLGVVFANASPSWVYNTGVRTTNPSGVGCSSFTKEYDPYSGRVKYRCNSNVVQHNKFLVASSPIEGNGEKASYATRAVAFQGTAATTSGRSSLGGPQSKAVTSYYPNHHRSQAYGRSRQGFAKTRPNRCPPGQIFQSELNICIPENLGPPLPPPGPSRPSNPRQARLLLLNSFDHNMLADAAAPVRPSSSYPQQITKPRWQNNRMLADAAAPIIPSSSYPRQITKPRWSIISVGKFDIKNRCKPHEILVSELDICLPRNNCFPYSKTC